MGTLSLCTIAPNGSATNALMLCTYRFFAKACLWNSSIFSARLTTSALQCTYFLPWSFWVLIWKIEVVVCWSCISNSWVSWALLLLRLCWIIRLLSWFKAWIIILKFMPHCVCTCTSIDCGFDELCCNQSDCIGLPIVVLVVSLWSEHWNSLNIGLFLECCAMICWIPWYEFIVFAIVSCLNSHCVKLWSRME